MAGAVRESPAVKALLAFAAWLLITSAALAAYLAWVHQPFL